MLLYQLKKLSTKYSIGKGMKLELPLINKISITFHLFTSVKGNMKFMIVQRIDLESCLRTIRIPNNDNDNNFDACSG